MSERALRDELEQLQVQARTLEAELAVDHSPAFLSKRDEAMQRLDAIRTALAGLEQTLRTTQVEQQAARGEVDRLAGELHTVEQRRLGVAPFVLLPVTFAVVGGLISNGVPLAPAGFLSALSLGYLFGPRLLDWFRPGQVRAPLVPTLGKTFVEGVWRNQGTAALMLSLLTTFAGVVCGRAIVRELIEGGGNISPEVHFLLSAPVQFLAPLTVWFAMGARRRVALGQGSGKWTALVAAGLAMFSLLGIALSWVPSLLRPAEPFSFAWLFFPLSSFAMVIPASLGMWAQAEPKKNRPWLVAPALIFAAASLLFSFAVRGERAPLFGPRIVAGLWLSVQLGVGSLLLSWEFARRERKRLRWLAPAISLLAIGLSVLFAMQR